MARKLIKVLLIAVLVLSTLVAATPWALYAYGLRVLPADSSPSREPSPNVVMQLQWLSLAKTTTMHMEPMSPWTWFKVVSNDPNAFPAGHQVAGYAARLVLNRASPEIGTKLKQHLQNAAVTTWISRTWTTEEAVRTILAESYFGHGFHGLREATQGYFGRPPEGLSASEAAVVVTVSQSPSYLSPWCNPERSLDHAKRLLARIQPDAKFAPRLLPAPPGACKR
jgi:hypothetical protein